MGCVTGSADATETKARNKPPASRRREIACMINSQVVHQETLEQQHTVQAGSLHMFFEECTMKMIRWTSVVAGLCAAFALGWLLAGKSAHGGGDDAPAVKGWTKGKGWGPWGADDELGSLNAMTPATVKAALSLAKQGKVYDLGVPYDADSYKWPGHSPGAILTFRGPEGVQRQGDFKAAADPELNPARIGWHSCALFM